ncbi:MAG: phosphopantetheine-binding protein [Candidatus Methylophosphatis roskildensis]|jgi:acyl carrier protein|uniref:Acyl carrier protein n=1 Tax=Candidatus Methylophosphatis roskildensis TaxID=2899263 RepID=A0A9D7E2P2_9PROT|nr:acyl carrier protein [Candidatus Methylophosphatis roskildensis]MBK7234112.1 acyl carrier protein [Sterolibacteriaceae bacterium]MBK8338463.1 acyl carrier protein [Candidatus Methylophosphatis haderslevensis]
MPDPTESVSQAAAPDEALLAELARLIVSALNLDIKPEEIQPDVALYGEGLGLDSIDILEVALAVSKHFGVQLRADNENNVAIFRSLRSLADFVAANRSA